MVQTSTDFKSKTESIDNQLFILHLEDNDQDAELIERLLKKEFPECNIMRVLNRHEYIEKISYMMVDLILSDFAMPSFDGLDALELVFEQKKDIPFIFVSGHIGETRAIEALKKGATDYVLKDHLDKLVPSIKRVIKEQEEKRKRLEVEYALIESQKKYKTLFDSAASAILLVQNDIIIECNLKALEIYGCERDDLVGKMFFEFSPEFQTNGQKSSIARAEKFKNALKGKAQTFEWKQVRKSSEEFDSDISLSSLIIGEYTTIQVIVRDISENKKIEQALKDSEEKYRELVENIYDVIFAVDLNGKLEFVSNAISDLIGFTPEELIGKHFSNFFDSESLKEEKNNIQQVFEEDIEPIELIVTHKNGDKKWVRISRTPILINNKVTGIRGVVSDITEKKNAEKELIIAKEKAEEMNKLKSNFLSNMSHELRTPMIGIIGGAELLIDELSETEQLEMATIIFESGQRLLSTLNLLLDLSRVESDKINIELSEIELNESISLAVSAYEKIAQNKGLYIKKNLYPEPLYFNTDERLLRGIINNLLSNSIKFTDAGGVTLGISAKKDIKGNIKSVILTVEDTGIGIPEDKHDLIFEEFRQLSEGINREFQGTGLGLTVTKKIVNSLNGEISVKSRLGMGSVFTVTLPIMENFSKETIENNMVEEIEMPLTSNKEEEIAPDKSIICLEDDEVTCKVLEYFLKDSYLVKVVNTPEKFFKELGDQNYKLIILDINLGKGKSGVDILKLLKNNNKYADTPIIAMTAYALQGDREYFLETGFDEYISKPFSKDSFFNVIEKFI